MKSSWQKLIAVCGILIIGVMLGCLLTRPALTNEDTLSENHLAAVDVKGVYGSSVDSIKAAQTKEDFNWDAGKIFMEVDEALIRLNIPALGEKASFSLKIYPSTMGMDCANKIIGVEQDNLSNRYRIARFIIEKSASHLYLFKPNSDLLNKTIVHLGIIDTTTGEVYLTQFAGNQFDYDTMYSKLSNGSYTDTELANIELSYFSMQTLSELECSFSNVENMTVSGSGSVSVNDVSSNKQFEDTQGKILDEIENIPDSVYAAQENGKWTQNTLDWEDGAQVGYLVYHMNDIGTGNVLNYVLRYYIAANCNWDSQSFDISYNLTHHLWIQSWSESNAIIIQNIQPSDARILADADLTLIANEGDRLGYFTSAYNAYKTGNDALSAGPTFYFEGNTVSRVESDELKYAENRNSSAGCDYMGMTAYGTDITHIVWHYMLSWKTSDSPVFSLNSTAKQKEGSKFEQKILAENPYPLNDSRSQHYPAADLGVKQTQSRYH